MNKPSLPRGKVKRKIKRKKRGSYILPTLQHDIFNNTPPLHKKKCAVTRFQQVSRWRKGYSNLNWVRVYLPKSQTIILGLSVSASGKGKRYIMMMTHRENVFGRMKTPKSLIGIIRCFWQNGSDTQVCSDLKKQIIKLGPKALKKRVMPQTQLTQIN